MPSLDQHSTSKPLTRHQRRLLQTIAQISPGGYIPGSDGQRVAHRLVAKGYLRESRGGLCLTPLGGASLLSPVVPGHKVDYVTLSIAI